MKKFLFGAAVTILVASCSEKSSTSTTATANADSIKAMNVKFYAAMEKGDTAAMASLLTDDAIDHNGNPVTGADIVGKDSILAMLGQVSTCFKPGFKVNIISQAVDGDMVFVLSDMKGTAAEGNMMGMPAGKEIDMRGVDVSRVKDGKFSEHWAFMSMKAVGEMMSSMGSSMGAPATGPTDTAAKK